MFLFLFLELIQPILLRICFAGMASVGESNLLRISMGLLPPLPGMSGPVNSKRMEEMRYLLDTLQSALATEGGSTEQGQERMQSVMDLLREMILLLNDGKRREEAAPIVAEIQSVFQLVAVEVLEIRGSRAMRDVLRLAS